jgi:hypothetical protein
MCIVNMFLVFLIFLILSIILCPYIYEYYNDDPKIEELKNKLSVVFPDIKNIKIYNSSGKSYTINKHKVYLCTKDKDGKYYDDNMLIYVLLHEYSHILCDEIGHTEKFHDIFSKVVAKATLENLYDPKISLIENYCDHKT